jgi:hypothetical protein
MHISHHPRRQEMFCLSMSDFSISERDAEIPQEIILVFTANMRPEIYDLVFLLCSVLCL